MGMHPNDQKGPRRASPEAYAANVAADLASSERRDADYAKLAESRNRLSTMRLAKGDKEALLREIRKREQLYGIPGRNYNGGVNEV